MAELDQQLEDVLLALEGFKKTNEKLQLNVETRKELAQIQKWDLEPKAGISAIDEYIRRNKITADMIRSMDMTLRNDGFLSIVLVWGRVYPIVIAGAKGDTGPQGNPGPKGFRGLNAQCECPEIIASSSSGLSSSTSSLASSSTSGDSSSSEDSSSSSSYELSSSSSLSSEEAILLEDGSPIELEDGDDLLME